MSGGFRTSAERHAFQALRDRGWESQGRNGSNHLVLHHPQGARLTLPSASTDDVYRRLLRTAARLEACYAPAPIQHPSHPQRHP